MSVDEVPEAGRRSERGAGLRAIGLYFFAVATSIVAPGPVLAVGFVVEVLRNRTRGVLVWMGGLLGALYFAGGAGSSSLWYVERGWAVVFVGGFTALGMRYRIRDALTRGVAAVALASVAVAVLLSTQPGAWDAIDQAVRLRITEGVNEGILSLGEVMNAETAAAVRQVSGYFALVFPAVLGLASIAALTVGRWLYGALGGGPGHGPGPWREVRFSDHLVWVMIAGIGLVLVSGVSAETVPIGMRRLGINVVTFMTALYVLRGWGVLLWLWSGTIWMVMMTVILVLFAPFAVGLAAAVGLGDTWLDIRTKARELMPRDKS